jgi:acetyltransferase-like isoleucine patch superfamily enzyme
MLEKVMKFYRANGSYITALEMRSRVMSKLIGAFIGSRTGSTRAHIGPRAFIRGLSCIIIGEGFESAEGLWLEAVTSFNKKRYTPKIVIGDNVHISSWSHITAVNYVEIGNDALIGSKVLISDHAHGTYSGKMQSDPRIPPMKRDLVSGGPVIVGPNVWIGDGVVVLPGCIIGEGSIVGANSVVTSNIPPFTIVAGSPARILKRFDINTMDWV